MKCKKKDKISVFRSQVKIPFLHGIVKPRIYLPCYEFSDNELIGILHHEYNHYLHKDIIVKILVNLFCIFFWWNPMVYLLKANLNHALEIKCDIDLIVDLSEDDRILYLESIMRIVKLGAGSISRIADNSAGMVTAEGKKLEQRFRIVIEYAEPGWKARLTKVLFYAVMIFLLLVSFMFILQPYRAYSPLTTDTGVIDMDGGPGNGLSYYGAEAGSYLIKNDDDTYSLCVDGKIVSIITEIKDGIENLQIIQD